MLRKISLRKRSTTLALLVFGVLLGAAGAQTESVFYSFCGQGVNCTDGANPYAGVVFDQKGNLYGTTYYGGVYNSRVCDTNFAYGCGVVFKLDPAGKETVLHSFCAQANCADGANPYAGLIFDQKGNLYGTASGGGAYNNGCLPGTRCGVVFKLTPEGEETVLYSFCAKTGCADGANPSAGLVLDQEGNLYGTTVNGGAGCTEANPCGVVFKLTPEGKETVLHRFCVQERCSDGLFPSGPLIFDQKGNLYGTTASGGAYDKGVVFKITPKGKETVLYSFCGLYNCPDGAYPYGGLVFDQKGNLYGTTEAGGALGGGTVFELTAEGTETVLYGFCALNNCADGLFPSGPLVFDQKGNLYGTTSYGGDPTCSNGCGVAFKLTPKGKYTILHSFCAQSNCTDGEYPYAGLVFDQKGNLYGTTGNGGVSNSSCADPSTCGVIFKLTP